MGRICNCVCVIDPVSAHCSTILGKPAVLDRGVNPHPFPLTSASHSWYYILQRAEKDRRSAAQDRNTSQHSADNLSSHTQTYDISPIHVLTHSSDPHPRSPTVNTLTINKFNTRSSTPCLATFEPSYGPSWMRNMQLRQPPQQLPLPPAAPLPRSALLQCRRRYSNCVHSTQLRRCQSICCWQLRRDRSVQSKR